MSTARRTQRAISALPLRRPRTTVGLVVLTFGLSLWAILTTHLDADVQTMLDFPSARTYSQVSAAYGWGERAFVLIETERDDAADQLVARAEAIDARLSGDPAIAEVAFRIERPDAEATARLLFPCGLLLLNDAELVAELLTYDGMIARLEQTLANLSAPGIGDAEAQARRDPLGLSAELGRRLAKSRGGFEFMDGRDEFLATDGRALLMVVTGSGDREALRRAVVGAMEAGDGDGLLVRATGPGFLEAESQAGIQSDLATSLSASIVLAVILLALGLRQSPWRAAMLVLPTIWGMTIGIGAFAALRASASALAFASAAILIGLGIDFTIHATTSAFHERSKGRSPLAALRRALRETRPRLVAAALTSIAAFLAFVLADAVFLRQMGILTVLGLAGCLISPFVVLPPILLAQLRRADRTDAAKEIAPARLMETVALSLRHPVRVVGLAAVVTVLAVVQFAAAPPGVEDDLRNIHAPDSESLGIQQRIADRFGASFEPLLLLTRADSESAAADASAKLGRSLQSMLDDGTLVDLQAASDVLPSTGAQQETLTVLRDADSEEVANQLRVALDDVGFDATEFENYVAGFVRAVERAVPATPEDIRAAGLGELVDRFVTDDGGGQRAYGLTYAQPGLDLWAGDLRRDVLQRVRGAAESTGLNVEITGMHPVAADSASRVVFEFQSISLLTLAAVLIVLVLRFRSPARVATVLVPAGLGAIWVAGLCAALGQKLNLMNIGVLPMVLALGIDDGIHVVMHFRDSSARGTARVLDVLKATGSGVVLTSVTTMVTFGSLALSSSQGMASVGLLTLFGVGSCLIASITVLPALLILLDRRTNRSGDPGRT